jgi:hypothetical protein
MRGSFELIDITDAVTLDGSLKDRVDWPEFPRSSRGGATKSKGKKPYDRPSKGPPGKRRGRGGKDDDDDGAW